ncbi:MAG: hypothetical protein M1815_004343 [Lichina confinis]|nr:MAG: hypothetical protein M1815_004343 [Lichina confinis]
MAPSFLDKCQITATGTFRIRHAAIRDIAEECGAEYARAIRETCTHVIATPTAFSSGATAVERAAKWKIRVVDIQWLLDCKAQGKRLPEANYALTSVASGSSATGNTASTADAANAARSKPVDSSLGLSKRQRSNDASSDEDNNRGSGTEETSQVAKRPKNSENESSKTLNVPVDEYCGLGDGWHVYIASEDEVFDATLIQSAVEANSNKFYQLQILIDPLGKYRTFARWGRVGERGQIVMQPPGGKDEAVAFFQRKFREKTGLYWVLRTDPAIFGKYAYMEKNYEREDDDGEGASASSGGAENGSGQESRQPQCTLVEPVEHLVDLLFNAEYFSNTIRALKYDTKKLPLGKLSRRTLLAGYDVLRKLADVLTDPRKAQTTYGTTHIGVSGPDSIWMGSDVLAHQKTQAVTNLTSSYYTIIPHAFGRDRPVLISTEKHLKEEVDKLDTLSKMGLASEIMHDKIYKDDDGNAVHFKDSQFRRLRIKSIEPLSSLSAEFKALEDYLVKSSRTDHHLKFRVETIFRIERTGENERFSQRFECVKPETSDRRLLWHGSVTTNFAGILSEGLRIAPLEAPKNGYMFGKGIYLADASSKSANYCRSFQTGGLGLLLLCEADVGRPTQLITTGAKYDAAESAASGGFIATEGIGGRGPSKWKDAGVVHPDLRGVLMPDCDAPELRTPDTHLQYNEYVVYNEAYVRLRYLFRIRIS